MEKGKATRSTCEKFSADEKAGVAEHAAKQELIGACRCQMCSCYEWIMALSIIYSDIIIV